MDATKISSKEKYMSGFDMGVNVMLCQEKNDTVPFCDNYHDVSSSVEIISKLINCHYCMQ